MVTGGFIALVLGRRGGNSGVRSNQRKMGLGRALRGNGADRAHSRHEHPNGERLLCELVQRFIRELGSLVIAFEYRWECLGNRRSNCHMDAVTSNHKLERTVRRRGPRLAAASASVAGRSTSR